MGFGWIPEWLGARLGGWWEFWPHGQKDECTEHIDSTGTWKTPSHPWCGSDSGWHHSVETLRLPVRHKPIVLEHKTAPWNFVESWRLTLKRGLLRNQPCYDNDVSQDIHLRTTVFCLSPAEIRQTARSRMSNTDPNWWKNKQTAMWEMSMNQQLSFLWLLFQVS